MSNKKLNALLSKAIRIVAVAFEGKYDRGGYPYFLHCYEVMSSLHTDDIELKIIAILHDLIEDTDWTIDRLRTEGFTERVLTALKILTRDHNDKSDEEYDNYISLIGTNYDTLRVKKKDLKHNMDPSRLKKITEKDNMRLLKYNNAFHYLSEKESHFEHK